MYVRRSRWLVAQCGTYGLAASATAGESLFGSRQATFPWQVMPCGIDFTPFAPGSVREDIRREFGIPSDSIVVGHVGRFAEQKNHAMILDIAEAIRRRTDKFHLLLVGDGPLQARIAEDVNQRGLASCITFAGVRADVPRLFTSLFDVFLFPSLFEGLGLVLVEAQAAGCPVVISDVIPQEADMVSRLVTRIPLTMNVDHWAKAVLLAAQASRSRAARLSAYETVASSAFNISVCRQNLTSLYIDQLSNRRAA
jgi:glycosyltransferase involved in cell wall biosynthesis